MVNMSSRIFRAAWNVAFERRNCRFAGYLAEATRFFRVTRGRQMRIPLQSRDGRRVQREWPG
jgi:hypothetical protein